MDSSEDNSINPSGKVLNSALPPKPEEPLSTDCCGSGCTPCVFDIYEQEIKKWEKECKSWNSKSKDVKTNDFILSQIKFKGFRLDMMTRITDSTWIYRFCIPDGSSLGLKTGQHIVLRNKSENSWITSQYTPVSRLDVEGYFDVIIKIYDEGRMSQYIKTWRVGDMIEWKGPFGNFTYSPNKHQFICMLAAGTGIAPMIQVLHAILDNELDETRVKLLYSSTTYQDILMKDDLDVMQDYWNFNVKYFLTKDNHGNQSQVQYRDKVHYGRIVKNTILDECPSPDIKPYFLICGTKSFDKDMINYISSLGYDTSLFYKF